MKWAQIVVFAYTILTTHTAVRTAVKSVEKDRREKINGCLSLLFFALALGFYLFLLYFAGAFDTLVPSVWETP